MDDFQPPRPQPAPKKSSWLRNLIVILLLLILTGAIIYAWASVKHPEWFDKGDIEPAPDPDAPINIDKEADKETMYKVIALILGGGVVILIGYIIWRGWGKQQFALDTKVPVAPDKAIILFKQNFCLKNDIEAVYDKEINAYAPANPRAISINDKVPYFHTATGDNFLLLEIEVREGDQQGLHTIVIPIDKGEEVIKQGYYRQDTHTPRFQFNLQKINYPMSSLADKQDRLRLALMDRAEGDSEAMRNLTSIPQMPQEPYITTPLDGYQDRPPIPPATKRQARRNTR